MRAIPCNECRKRAKRMYDIDQLAEKTKQHYFEKKQDGFGAIVEDYSGGIAWREEGCEQEGDTVVEYLSFGFGTPPK